MGQVQDSITTGRTRRNPRKLAWFTSDVIVAYALPVIEESIPSIYKEVKISSESEMHNAMLEEMKSLLQNDIWDLSELPKEKKTLVASEYLQRNIDLEKVKLFATMPYW